MTTGKTIALTIWTLVSKVLSLCFNTLSRFVITFLPRSKSSNFIAAVTICRILDTKKRKSLLSTFPPSICHEVMGPEVIILVFLMFSFKPVFSFSFVTLIKTFFSSSLLSAIRVILSAYLRLLIFLPAIFIPPCNSSSPAFRLICSVYKLNKQSDNKQLCHTPSSISLTFLVKVSNPQHSKRFPLTEHFTPEADQCH